MRNGCDRNARDTRGVDLVQQPEECRGSLDQIAPGRERVGAMRMQGTEPKIGLAGARRLGVETEFGARRVVALKLARRMWPLGMRFDRQRLADDGLDLGARQAPGSEASVRRQGS